MGVILSRFDKEHYYANYEKAFAKLEKDQTTISQRTQTRETRRKHLTVKIYYTGAILTLVTAIYASWVFQQDSDAFTNRGRAFRLSLFIIVPSFLILCHHVLLFGFDVFDQWDRRTLQKLEKTRDDMLKDIKDRNRYDRIQALLKKYDPEEQKKLELLKKMELEPIVPHSEPKKASFRSSLITGAGKIIDTLANSVIGDQPELLREMEVLRSTLQELQQKNEALIEENRILKEHVVDENRSTDRSQSSL